MPDFPARTVVEKAWSARCTLDNCGQEFPPRATFAEASDDRQAHLTWHRLGQPDNTKETPR